MGMIRLMITRITMLAIAMIKMMITLASDKTRVDWQGSWVCGKPPSQSPYDKADYNAEADTDNDDTDNDDTDNYDTDEEQRIWWWVSRRKSSLISDSSNLKAALTLWSQDKPIC